MKFVIAGASGQIGTLMKAHWIAAGHQVISIVRQPKLADDVAWNGSDQGPWTASLERADVVLNLAGRSVNCRYSRKNLDEMMESRIRSTLAVGQAMQESKNPPLLWLQMSTATIYAHRFDAPNDEATGILGGQEPNAPPKWVASIEIAKA